MPAAVATWACGKAVGCLDDRARWPCCGVSRSAIGATGGLHEAGDTEERFARRETGRGLTRPDALYRRLLPGADLAGRPRRLEAHRAASGGDGRIAGDGLGAVGAVPRERRPFAAA